MRRPFPSRQLPSLDPILLLDELGPIEYGPGEAIGAPDHPHRGMETVTYVLEGEGAHADSSGHAGTIGPGDVQWMTAGSGVVHREMPGPDMMRRGGRSHGFQIWVNLPRVHKMTTPRYREIRAASIPVVKGPGRILAGDAMSTKAAIETFVPVLIHHWSFEPGAQLQLDVPEEFTLAAYVFDGSLNVGSEMVAEGELALTNPGTTFEASSGPGGQCLLLGGRPLREPIAWQGPFVMNTRQELAQAFDDYRAGVMGSIPPEILRG